jgi:hypothetical protein
MEGGRVFPEVGILLAQAEKQEGCAHFSGWTGKKSKTEGEADWRLWGNRQRDLWKVGSAVHAGHVLALQSCSFLDCVPLCASSIDSSIHENSSLTLIYSSTRQGSDQVLMLFGLELPSRCQTPCHFSRGVLVMVLPHGISGNMMGRPTDQFTFQMRLI